MNMDQQQELISEARMELEPLIEQIEEMPKAEQRAIINGIKILVQTAIEVWERDSNA